MNAEARDPAIVVEQIDLSFRVLSDESHRLLTELRRFRRFKRYYLELDDDWEKLTFLLSVVRRCIGAFRDKIARGLEEGA